MLQAVLPATARTFARAIVMPNLRPPITTVDAALAYRSRILSALPQGLQFEPLMTAYLTDDLDPDELERGFREGVFTAAKLYPANATTNSAAGVSDLDRIAAVLERMESIDMPLLIHGEVTDPEVDIFDREAAFIDQHLIPLRRRHPGLRIVLEHITTEQAATYIRDQHLAGDQRLAATITPHHLHLNRNAMFMGGLRSDFYCLPVVKRECHRQALIAAATSGLPCFFLGTDSAPTPVLARSRLADVPGFSMRSMPLRVMPASSSKPVLWTVSKALPVNMVLASTDCLSTTTPSRSCASSSQSPLAWSL